MKPSIEFRSKVGFPLDIGERFVGAEFQVDSFAPE
jgi:hypothetical protein